jgi:hypothetical protein
MKFNVISPAENCLDFHQPALTCPLTPKKPDHVCVKGSFAWLF